MNFQEALSELRSFWTEPRFPFEGGGGSRLTELEAEYGRVFPPELREYVGSIISSDRFVFESIGNPIDVYGFTELSRRLEGYNYNPLTNEVLSEWSDDWFLIGDEGADPIIVDLSSSKGSCRVLQSMHGEGEWDFSLLASSLPQFLLLSAARHHALLMLGFDERISDDERGFNLAPAAADWLFPRLKRWAPEVYGEWVGAFDNA